MHYFQFNIPDWVMHTSHLSLEEEAVYLRLLYFYYDTEGPIPRETQPVLRRLRIANHSDIAEQILSEFFRLDGDFWHHKRVDRELEVFRERAERAKQNGRKGGRPRKYANSEGSKPRETQPVIFGNPEKSTSKANQEPITTNQEPKDKPTCAEPSGSPPAVRSEDPVVFGFPTNKHETSGEQFLVTESLITELRSLYPGVDVTQDLRNMLGWLKANRAKRKTLSGMPKFIHAWLAKEQNRGGPNGAHQPSSQPRTLSAVDRVRLKAEQAGFG